MERFANSAERRYDPASGYFRGIPGFDKPPGFHATELVHLALGSILGYRKILLDLANQEKRDSQEFLVRLEEPITPEHIRSLLVKAAGLHSLAEQRIKSHVEAAREKTL